MGTADVPVVMQRQVLVIQRVQRTVDVPLVQYIDTIVDVPVVKLPRTRHFQTVQKTLEVPENQCLDRVVDVPVVMVQQMATESPQERVQQRTVEFEHQPQLTLAFIEKEKPDCRNSGITHAVRAAAESRKSSR